VSALGVAHGSRLAFGFGEREFRLELDFQLSISGIRATWALRHTHTVAIRLTTGIGKGKRGVELKPLIPMQWRHFLSAITVLIALSVSAGMASAQDATTPTPGIAVADSYVAGVDISGLDETTALTAIDTAFAAPIVIRIGARVFRVTSSQVDATYDVQAAVAAAVSRPAGGNTPVTTTYSETKLQDQVRRILRLTSDKGSVSAWVIRAKPRIKRGKAGSAPDGKVIENQIRMAINQPMLRAQQETIPLVGVNTSASLARLGYVIAVSKSERILRLYAPVKGKAKAVQTFQVAVGAPSFPTPSGTFTIVNKQKNPWWYPPTSTWAKGEKPIPPGPTNPLGTRWMGLDREDVGIHGTPDSSSLGGYASHGCVRMYIPSAEKLYSLVSVGTPVIIF
jgi:lipoprotein-anchoring transpeptidase ErfK/SrfK